MEAEFRCICDPNDLFDPPNPTPRAVYGCPAHNARRAAQQFAEAPCPFCGAGMGQHDQVVCDEKMASWRPTGFRNP